MYKNNQNKCDCATLWKSKILIFVKLQNMENQNTEYKESWRDEYIKWICGFANANGGTMYVGIDDKGHVKGIYDAKKLAEDLPNKVKDILGVLVDVNIKTEAGKDYLEIITDAYPYPVNYKGSYFYRSGATNQELKRLCTGQVSPKKARFEMGRNTRTLHQGGRSFRCGF